ncbi:putative pectinesterase [Helianthus annuus]|nr:putative pectinesterase [Helianthus annuus]KAJ0487851.1 putative pectinesterase [Helianthus annuus]KAJ0658322.1 putative pectinesterase [Helianthus annuus]KAJ0661983.1 putative pectinesterase [Helianthus annuus]
MNLEYGRLGKYQPGRNRPDTPLKPQLYPAPTTNANSKIKLLLIFALALIVVSLLSVGLVVHLRTKSPQGGSRPIIHPRPTEAMSRVCARTRYQNLCLNSLLDFPGSSGASDKDMIHISVNMTLQRVGRALYTSAEISNLQMNTRQDLSKLVSNCLAIYAAASDGDDFNGVPIQHRRRRLMSYQPEWLKRKERRLLQAPIGEIQADIVVSQDGNGTCKTIAEAIKKAPEYSNRRTIIYVRAGRYEEANLKVGRKKWNLMFIGDGKGKTVITGGVNVVVNNVTTFHTASFAATGSGFIARDMTFENYAGPAKHQAVALRVGADKAVVYRCNVIGYQDTLYVHSQRQFFRECDIYGTVDFIFGNAAVVFQNCSMYARKPMPLQKVTITAQNRKDPNQNTGISIHACRLLAQPDMEAAKSNFSTYLGRPWKLYSRTVYMQTYMGDHIHPRGWLEWNATFALDTLYYGEYMNYGPGGAIGQRVKWPGYRVITAAVEASRFTVAQFIYGSSWLPSTGVAFLAGLSQ